MGSSSSNIYWLFDFEYTLQVVYWAGPSKFSIGATPKKQHLVDMFSGLEKKNPSAYSEEKDIKNQLKGVVKSLDSFLSFWVKLFSATAGTDVFFRPASPFLYSSLY